MVTSDHVNKNKITTISSQILVLGRSIQIQECIEIVANSKVIKDFGIWITELPIKNWGHSLVHDNLVPMNYVNAKEEGDCVVAFAGIHVHLFLLVKKQIHAWTFTKIIQNQNIFPETTLKAKISHGTLLCSSYAMACYHPPHHRMTTMT